MASRNRILNLKMITESTFFPRLLMEIMQEPLPKCLQSQISQELCACLVIHSHCPGLQPNFSWWHISVTCHSTKFFSCHPRAMNESAESRDDVVPIIGILFQVLLLGLDMMKKKKSYLLLLLVHWVLDYLVRWYGVCAKKTVYYHLDAAYYVTNIDLMEEKTAYPQKEITLQWGGTASCCCTWVFMCSQPTSHTPVRLAAQVSRQWSTRIQGVEWVEWV